MQNQLKKLLTIAMTGVVCACFSQGAFAQEIALENPGFESDLQGWSAVPKNFSGQAEVVTGTFHSGEKSLRVDASEKDNRPFVLRRVTNLEGGATYRLSAWARGTTGQAGQIAALKIEYYNAAGANTSGAYSKYSPLPANGEWKQIEVTMPADFDTTFASLYVRVMNKGAIFFDDMKFEKVRSAPDIVVLQPRMAAPGGTPINAHFEIWLREWNQGTIKLPKGALPVVSFEVQGAGETKTYPAKVESLGEQRFAVSAQLPALAEGDYSITIKSGGWSTQDPARVFVTPKNRQPKNLTDTGTLLWNGKPFFPIGMYHPYQRENDYKLLSENGFNAVQSVGPGDLDRFKADLDLAQKYGLACDVPLYAGGEVKGNLEKSLEGIRRFKDHPSILCWKIIDEPDISSNTSVADEVPEAYRALKAADPVHPIELTMAHDATLEYWSNFCDLVQIDRYPVPARPLTDVYDFARNAVAAKKPWQNLTFVVQSGWVADLSNQPTVAQARSMVYLSLIAGAKGIFWYSMREPSWDLTTTPFWPKMKAINAEIQTLSEPIMLGEVVKGIESDNPKVFFTARRHHDKLFVFLTNPETTPQKATFTLQKNLRVKNGRHLAAHPDGGSTPVPLQGNQFSLDLSANDSRTLVFDAQGK
jgi:hypothetical protein